MFSVCAHRMLHRSLVATQNVCRTPKNAEIVTLGLAAVCGPDRKHNYPVKNDAPQTTRSGSQMAIERSMSEMK
jgi:hypothetical protein